MCDCVEEEQISFCQLENSLLLNWLFCGDIIHPPWDIAARMNGVSLPIHMQCLVHCWGFQSNTLIFLNTGIFLVPFCFLLLFPQIPTFWKTIAGFSSFLFLKSPLPLLYSKQYQRGNIFLWSPFPAFVTCRQEIIYSKPFQISSLRHSRYIKSVVQRSDCSGVQLTAEPTWQFSNALKTSSPVSSLFTRY